MTINFVTPTRLSLLDITSMGDSSKREDISTIGQFDSGLKYAIALLLRHNVNIDIGVYGGKEDRDNYEEDFTELYNFDTYKHKCESTGKEKELIGVTLKTIYHGGTPSSQHDMREPSLEQERYVKTGFAKALGHNWELWMALRELWSNMLDEKGYIVQEEQEVEYGTIVSLTFNEDNPFNEVWKNRHLYINEKEPDYIISSIVDALKNDEGYLRIYKQNILVYENRETPSRFSYNIKFGDIDERRILSNVYSVEGTIQDAILNTKNEEYLKQIITPTFQTKDKEFLSSRSNYFTASDVINNIVTEVYKEHGEVRSYEWLIDAVKKRGDCQIKGRIINTVEDSLWDYNSKVSIETEPVEVSKGDTLENDIETNYNFKVNVNIKRASLKGSKVVADKHNNCLIVDYEFNTFDNMSEFFVQYIELTKKGNVVKNMGDYIAEILKK